MPEVDHLTFRGGLKSKYLFEDSRYCFVYGQFLATVMLSLAFIERILAALFYEVGQNELERKDIAISAKQALKQGWLVQDEYDWLVEVRRIRNPKMHFRKLGGQPGEQARDDW